MGCVLYHVFCVVIIVAEHIKHPRPPQWDSLLTFVSETCGLRQSRFSLVWQSRTTIHDAQLGRSSGRPGAPNDERRTANDSCSCTPSSPAVNEVELPTKTLDTRNIVDTGTEPARATIVPTNGLSSSLAIWRHQTQPASILKPSQAQPRARYGGQKIRGRERAFDQQARARTWLTVRVVKHGDILVRLRGGTGWRALFQALASV